MARAGSSLLAVLLWIAAGAAAPAPQQSSTPRADAPTPHEIARAKLDAHLRVEIDRRRGRPAHASRPGARIRLDQDGRALVDIRARMLGPLARKIERIKGRVVETSLLHGSLVAWVPLDEIETLAGIPSILSIDPAPKSFVDHVSVR